MRRRKDDYVNATHILKAAGFDKPARTRILEREVQRGTHEKVQGGYGKYQGERLQLVQRKEGFRVSEFLRTSLNHVITGTWIPLHDARLLAERNNVFEKIQMILDFDPNSQSPPPAPKLSSTNSSAPKRGARKSTNSRATPKESFSVSQASGSMAPPALPQDHHMGLDPNESIEFETSSMIADDDMSQYQVGHKRKRDTSVMSMQEQEHIMYGDQLLDYFMTVGDAPQATRVRPPQPPANFQINKPIDDSGNTALHWACSMGDLEIVHDLLSRGADMNTLSSHEETPLVRAVLFTNNYEKKTFPSLVDLLIDTVNFRDWFGATIFHHIAETTRSKGKWRSARYYCETLWDKLGRSFSSDEIDLLMGCQDNNGDTAALVAARNGAFRLVSLFIDHSPRSGQLVNNKGETAANLLQRYQAEHEAPPAPSSVTMANDHIDGEMGGIVPSDHQSVAPVDSSTHADLLSKISSVMAEANKKLAGNYGNSRSSQEVLNDIANPQALFVQLESDRENIQRQLDATKAKEGDFQHIDLEELRERYQKLRASFESLVELNHRIEISRQMAMHPATNASTADPSSASPEELVARFNAARDLVQAQKKRREAVEELVQQTADAGVSPILNVHRSLVALATGLKEDELDPLAGELADTLEFDRANNARAPSQPA